MEELVVSLRIWILGSVLDRSGRDIDDEDEMFGGDGRGSTRLIAAGRRETRPRAEGRKRDR